MKKEVLIILCFILFPFLFLSARTDGDESQFEKCLTAYIEALDSDFRHNKEILWRAPLNEMYDAVRIDAVRSDIKNFLSDTTIVVSAAQKSRIYVIDEQLNTYKKEAEAMIAAFNIEDRQLLENLEFATDATLVAALCRGPLSDWYRKSSLPSFMYSSEIPYIRHISEELNDLIEKLCDETTATPELLREFFDIKNRISTGINKSVND